MTDSPWAIEVPHRASFTIGFCKNDAVLMPPIWSGSAPRRPRRPRPTRLHSALAASARATMIAARARTVRLFSFRPCLFCRPSLTKCTGGGEGEGEGSSGDDESCHSHSSGDGQGGGGGGQGGVGPGDEPPDEPGGGAHDSEDGPGGARAFDDDAPFTFGGGGAVSGSEEEEEEEEAKDEEDEGAAARPEPRAVFFALDEGELGWLPEADLAAALRR